MASDDNSQWLPSRAKPRRSRRGCLTCRQRKVKCDETREICQNCFRLDARCTWETLGATSEPGRRRSRNWRACVRCREKKLRCTASSSGPGCGQCLKARTTCEALIAVEAPGTGQAALPVDVAMAVTSDSDLAPRHELLSILNVYFECPHFFCYSTFIHRPSFMKMLENGLIPRSLLLIVFATGLRSMGRHSSVADAWADESRNLVVLDVFSRISTTNLQTLLLLQRYEWHRGVHLGAWFLSGLAYRLAHALQLHLEPADVCGDPQLRLPQSVVETRRRLIWSCFVMDSVPDAHQSGTRPLQNVLDPSVIRSRLPCDEALYEQGVEQSPGQQLQSTLDGPSISASVIKMVIIRQKILKYSSVIKSSTSDTPDSVWPWYDGSEFHDLKQQLDNLITGLAPKFQLGSYATVDSRSRSGFFTLHTMFHAAYTDLLRIGTYVGRLKTMQRTPPSAFVHACKVEQLKHACGIANVVTQCLQSMPCEHDPFIAICSCLAIRIIVVERWNDGKEVVSLGDERVKDGLEKCLECAKRTARWSMPIKKLLLAVGDLTKQYGYLLDVDEFKRSSTQPPQRAASRADSPSLHLYGTQGSMQKARDEHDLEDLEAVQDANAEPVQGLGPPLSLPGLALQLETRYSLSPEALRIASNWADGTYDLQMAQTNFDWGNFEFGLGFSPIDIDAAEMVQGLQGVQSLQEAHEVRGVQEARGGEMQFSFY